MKNARGKRALELSAVAAAAGVLLVYGLMWAGDLTYQRPLRDDTVVLKPNGDSGTPSGWTDAGGNSVYYDELDDPTTYSRGGMIYSDLATTSITCPQTVTCSLTLDFEAAPARLSQANTRINWVSIAHDYLKSGGGLTTYVGATQVAIVDPSGSQNAYSVAWDLDGSTANAWDSDPPSTPEANPAYGLGQVDGISPAMLYTRADGAAWSTSDIDALQCTLTSTGNPSSTSDLKISQFNVIIGVETLWADEDMEQQGSGF